MPPRERFDPASARTTRGAERRRIVRETDASKFDHRRREIALAAVAPLNRDGVKGMTLADVAARLNLAPTAVGYYFRGKEDLAATCYLISLERFSRLITLAEAAPAGEKVQALVREFVEFRRRVELGAEEEIAWFEDVRTIRRPEVDAAYVAVFRQIRALFPPNDDRGALNIAAHQVLSQLFWVVGWLPRYHPDDYARAAGYLIDILENGLAAAGRSWAPRALEIQGGSAAEGASARQVFLGAATDLINELGYLGASVQKISERVNVTKGSFYHHLARKDDLVTLCFQRTFEIAREAQKAADRQTDNGLDNLASRSTWLVKAHLTGATPLLRAAALAAVPADIRPELLVGFSQDALRTASVISDGVRDGSLRPVDASIAGQVITGAINSAAELLFWTPGTDAAAATDIYLKQLFTGVLAA